ncbi:ABC-2 type transport system ATP-binding protein [Sporobacter termitidis DSM 10068]|uniref:ABC-2 type transport system ATP-binding protein n=1 Tax=Sporobacter termitidis DSM 10068 TaxID=1123282 RepID=A0A1M5VU16_9FIRM|nr:ABC transporter ATP-binding protein [Sporobacter termitidis]SHH78688.1 ABC-2 type transport system ATP-binding protein [Sporobacter termitidis DSM 10068]
MSHALEVRGLKKEYKSFCLDSISFSLEEGTIMGFIGPNGAGKTTTIKAILNQIQRDAGVITLWGKDNIKDEVELKNRIGVVQDEGHFYGHLTLRAMKNMLRPFYKNWNEKTYGDFIREFGLDERKKISELSKGMRMKYSIALALSHEADLLIMDEPTSGLDPLVREELLELLQRMIQDEHKSVFFSTHITSDLDKIADYIVFLSDGKLVLNEQKDELLDRHAIVKGPAELLSETVRPYFVGVKQSGYGFEGLAGDRAAIRRALGSGAVFERPTVEDIMLYYTRKENGHAILN